MGEGGRTSKGADGGECREAENGEERGGGRATRYEARAGRDKANRITVISGCRWHTSIGRQANRQAGSRSDEQCNITDRRQADSQNESERCTKPIFCSVCLNTPNSVRFCTNLKFCGNNLSESRETDFNQIEEGFIPPHSRNWLS